MPGVVSLRTQAAARTAANDNLRPDAESWIPSAGIGLLRVFDDGFRVTAKRVMPDLVAVPDTTVVILLR